MDKFLPNDKEIINAMYQDRDVQPVGNLDDLLKLPLNEAYANNKHRFPATYKFSEVIKSKELQEELDVKIISNDIIKQHD